MGSTPTYLIVGILQKEKLTLVEVLHTLLAPHKLQLERPVLRTPGFTGRVHGIYHCAKALSRIFAPEQKSSAALQEESNILDICPRKVVQTDFKHV